MSQKSVMTKKKSTKYMAIGKLFFEGPSNQIRQHPEIECLPSIYRTKAIKIND
jgi:hypothetical protein